MSSEALTTQNCTNEHLLFSLDQLKNAEAIKLNIEPVSDTAPKVEEVLTDKLEKMEPFKTTCEPISEPVALIKVENELKSESKEKIYLPALGKKLYNAITTSSLDQAELTELTEALVKYDSRKNVFSFVKACCELFDTPKKKSLMLFLRSIVPVKDRFSYEEYYKLFFPSRFPAGTISIYKDLIPNELLEKTLKITEEKHKKNLEKEKLESEKNMGKDSVEKQSDISDEIKNLENDIKNDEQNYDLKKVIKSLMS